MTRAARGEVEAAGGEGEAEERATAGQVWEVARAAAAAAASDRVAMGHPAVAAASGREAMGYPLAVAAAARVTAATFLEAAVAVAAVMVVMTSRSGWVAAARQQAEVDL